MKVIKRNGSGVQYSRDKIIEAIRKASDSAGLSNTEKIHMVADKVEHRLVVLFFDNGLSPQVEEIQDIVEEELISANMASVAKKYILYREQKSKIRNTKKLFSDGIDSVNKYLDKLDWKVKENSNTGYSLQGLNQYLINEVVSQYWMQEIYPHEIVQSHIKGDLHIHDLSNLATYCNGWDMQDVMLNGFAGVSKKTESKPPKHFGTALLQIVNFFFTLQGESAGAQALSNFDTYLAPFIYYDNLDYKQVKQRMQEFIFNMNVPTRVGWQVPFTNITMDLVVPEFMKDEPAIIGGELQDKCYGEFQEYVDMFNKAFAEVMMEGDLKGRMFPFPIPTYNITEDFDWGNEMLNPIWEMTAKYGIPYFSNFINSDMKPEDARSMCPLEGKEKVLVKTSKNNIRYSQINHVYYDNKGKDVSIYADGKYIKGRFNKFENQEIIKVNLVNGHSIKMSKQHLNYVMYNENGKIEELIGEKLQSGYYLPYSLKRFRGNGGTYNLGYLIGAFAGDGSYEKESGVIFSLNNSSKLSVLESLKSILQELFGANFTINDCPNNVIKLSVYSPAVKAMIEQFVKGKNALNKYFNAKVFEMNYDFRTGIFDGYYDTDGGNRNRIYTSSERMVESLNMLAATLGTTTSVYTDDRTKKDGKLSDRKNYAILFYKLNRRNYGDIWFKKDSKLWVKIDSIEELESKQTAYCFEVENGEPVFTVGTTGILTHNCRLRLDNRDLLKRGGGLFGAKAMTGSIGVVTLNMPRIGYLADNKKDFIDRVLKLMDTAKESLIIKRKVIEGLADKGLYPYTKFYLRSVKERFGKYYGNHFNTIGINGMNEACLNLIGKNLSQSESIGFTNFIMKRMNERLEKYQEETGLLFNLEATPAESTSYRLAKIDQQKYGNDIIFANHEKVKKGAEPYYTNSTHLPVDFTDDIFTALDLQDETQTLYTGGTVLHGFLGENMPHIDATKLLVKRIAENYSLPYYSITPTFSICPVHGYLSGEHKYCPKCEVE